MLLVLLLVEGDVLLPDDDDVSLPVLLLPVVPDEELPDMPDEPLPIMAFVSVYAPLAPCRHPVRVMLFDDELELLWS